MLFWTVAGALAALVALILARPLLGRPDADEPASDRALYRDQLAEIGRDAARGLIGPEEAERARVEVARRLLAADRAAPAPVREPPALATRIAVAAVALLLVLGSLLAYEALGAPATPDRPRGARLAAAEAARDARPTQAEAEAAAPVTALDPPEDIAPLVTRLREEVPGRPDDLEGWTLLAAVEGRLGRYAEAARAQARVVALKGDAATVEDRSTEVDFLVAAAGNVVTPEAEAVLAEVAAADPAHPAVLYYLGLLDWQTGRPDRAFPLWRRLVEEGPEGVYRDGALEQIPGLAAEAGVDWSPPAEAAGPDAAAQDEMIRGMVEGLRARLAADGGPPEDWARLVTSLSVLGDAAGARAALEEGRAAHAGDEAGLAVLADAATRAGLE